MVLTTVGPLGLAAQIVSTIPKKCCPDGVLGCAGCQS